MQEFIIGVLGAGIGAGIMTIIQMFIKRKWSKEDKQEEKEDKLAALTAQLEDVNKKLDALSQDVGHVKIANQSILSDRIQWLGTRYLEDGEIDFEDRRILKNLHNSYHDHCGGNGDFDELMKDIYALPLKLK